MSDSPSFEDEDAVRSFTASTRDLLAHEAAAGVTHHVALSPVGTERLLESRYFRARFAQEQLIKASAIPYSIVRATPYFESLETIADVATHGAAVRVPPVLVQPIAADDVSRVVAARAVVLLMGDVAVFSVAGGFCATQAMCTHRAGPLSEGTVDDISVTCPLHGSQFNIWTGAVLRGPAKEPLRTYPVIIDGDVGRVDVD